MKTNTGILGVSGYTGQELVKLLDSHPNFHITKLFSTSIDGDYVNENPASFTLELPFVETYDVSKCSELDCIFLAVPHTKAFSYVFELRQVYPNLKIIDLSADFRLTNPNDYLTYYNVAHPNATFLSDAVYGLPERYFDQIASASLVANPGCYATAMILGLLPLKDQLSVDIPVVIDAKSGVSGAGRSLKLGSLFCEVHDSISAYATGVHRHEAELKQEVGFKNVMFSPHLIPTRQGIEAAIYIPNNQGLTQHRLEELFKSTYANAPFVTVMNHVTASTRLVVGSNQCVLIPSIKNNWIVIFSLIDNLIKGASGQAVQNANIMFGFDQTLGLN